MVINHMGTPTLNDLMDGERADTYWKGMAALAACGNVSLKVSMLCYSAKGAVDGVEYHGNWDECAPVVEAVHKAIKLFGTDRVLFASNYPVDIMEEDRCAAVTFLFVVCSPTAADTHPPSFRCWVPFSFLAVGRFLIVSAGLGRGSPRRLRSLQPPTPMPSGKPCSLTMPSVFTALGSRMIVTSSNMPWLGLT